MLLCKAITGGVTALSVVLGSSEIISLLKPGMHGSTFGGNPLTCAIALEAIKVIDDEGLADNALQMGNIFRERIRSIAGEKIIAVRGKGLLNAIAFDQTVDIKKFCHNLLDRVLLAKPTRNNAVRFTPPLIISEQQMSDSLDIISEAIKHI